MAIGSFIAKMGLGATVGTVGGAAYGGFEAIFGDSTTAEQRISDVWEGAISGAQWGAAISLLPAMLRMGKRGIAFEAARLKKIKAEKIKAEKIRKSAIRARLEKKGALKPLPGRYVRGKEYVKEKIDYLSRYSGSALGATALGAGAYATYSFAAPMSEQMAQSRNVARLQYSYDTNAIQYAEAQQFSMSPSPYSRIGANADLMNSTQGLVQGLNRTRHG